MSASFSLLSALPRGAALDTLTLSDACAIAKVPFNPTPELDWHTLLAQPRFQLGQQLSRRAQAMQRKVHRTRVKMIETAEIGAAPLIEPVKQALCGVSVNGHWGTNVRSTFHSDIRVDDAIIAALHCHPANILDAWYLACQQCEVDAKSDSGRLKLSAALAEAVGKGSVESYHELDSLLASHVALAHAVSELGDSQLDVEHRTVEPVEVTPSQPFVSQLAQSAGASVTALNASSVPIPALMSTASVGDSSLTAATSVRATALIGPNGPIVRRGFQSIMRLSDSLAALLGHRYLKRSSAVRLLWSYCKANQLQSKSDGKQINCDARLSALMGGMQTLSFNQLLSLITQHLTPVNRVSVEYALAEREADRVSEALMQDDKDKGIKRRIHKRKRPTQGAGASDEGLSRKRGRPAKPGVPGVSRAHRLVAASAAELTKGIASDSDTASDSDSDSASDTSDSDTDSDSDNSDTFSDSDDDDGSES